MDSRSSVEMPPSPKGTNHALNQIGSSGQEIDDRAFLDWASHHHDSQTPKKALTAEEEAELSRIEQSLRKAPCSFPGCNNNVIAQGLCGKHGFCSVPGCSTRARARGMCKKHGAKPCLIKGCTSQAVNRGRCTKHGGKTWTKDCTFPGCGSKAEGRGRCVKHGARGICSEPGCDAGAFARGRCRKHMPKATCSVADCNYMVRSRGVCKKHGKSSQAEKLPSDLLLALQDLCI